MYYGRTVILQIVVFGKLSKSHFNGNNELALDSFRLWAVDRSKYFHNNEHGIKFIPPKFFTGWITL